MQLKYIEEAKEFYWDAFHQQLIICEQLFDQYKEDQLSQRD